MSSSWEEQVDGVVKLFLQGRTCDAVDEALDVPFDLADIASITVRIAQAGGLMEAAKFSDMLRRAEDAKDND